MAQYCKKGRLVLLFLLFILTGCSLSPKGEPILTTEGSESEVVIEESVTEAEEKIWVHVCGAVKNPGVYSFVPGSRIVDAVEAAGGFTKKADQDSINLAALLEDASRIQIYTKGDQKEKNKEEAVGEEKDDKVNLNTAALEELMTLPGIGEKRAEAILKLRDQKGSFQKIEDLLEAEGIKEGIFQKIKDLIKV